jgi:glycerate dehydrogenase
MKIVILDGYTINPGDNPWSGLAAHGELTVHERTLPTQVVERAMDADIILTSKCRLDEAVIAALPRLKYVSLLATGYNNVDVAAAGRRGIPVANIPAYSTESVAQTAFALLLELTTGAGRHDRAVRDGKWCAAPDFSFCTQSIVELHGHSA